MNIYFILCQLIATITFLIMCKLILVAPTSKFFLYFPICLHSVLLPRHRSIFRTTGNTTSASGRIYYFAFL